MTDLPAIDGLPPYLQNYFNKFCYRTGAYGKQEFPTGSCVCVPIIGRNVYPDQEMQSEENYRSNHNSRPAIPF